MGKKTFYDYKIYVKKIIQGTIYKYTYGKFGYKSIIDSPLIIRNKKNIHIGNKVTIRANARIEVVTEYNGSLYNPTLEIGDGTIIEFNLHITCAKKISIGNNVLIAGYVTIIDNNHGYTNIEKPIYLNNLAGFKSIIIGDESFVGTGSIIMPGTNIGKHCVIGANSIVSGVIPDYSVAVGSPAKIIKRYNFEKGYWQKTDSEGNFIEE